MIILVICVKAVWTHLYFPLKYLLVLPKTNTFTQRKQSILNKKRWQFKIQIYKNDGKAEFRKKNVLHKSF